MSCIKNHKKFLFIHWMGPHRWKATRLRKFLPTSEKFIVDRECKLCGSMKSDHFISVSDLLESGIPFSTIEEASNNLFGVYLK